MQRYKLGDICEIVSGSTPKTNIEEYWNGDIKWITPAELDEESYIINDTARKITKVAVEKTGISSFPKGTVLLSSRAPIGKVAIAGCEMYCNQGFKNLICKNKVYNRYLYWFLKRNTKYLNSLGRGATFKEISKQIVSEIEINLPEMDHQKMIVEILEKLMKIIRLRKLEIEKLENLKNARFVEMFGLPVSNTKKWFTEKMSDVAPSINYTGKFNDKIWLLNLDMIEAQTGEIIGYLFVNEDEVGSSTCSFDTSNVLYSKLRPYLNKVVIPNRCGYATSELVPLQPAKGKLNREYLAFMLRSDEFVNMINEKVIGAKMPRVSMSEFRKFDVPIPPIELQNQFAAFVYQVNKSKFDYLLIISNPYIQNPNFAVKWS